MHTFVRGTTFFGSVLIVSARCSFRGSRRFSASSCFTRGSTGLGLGPRRRPRMSCKAPCSRCRRQLVSKDEYNPSRRNRAAQLAGLLAGVGLREDAEPILRGKASTLGLRRHFRIGIGRARRDRGAEGCGRPPGSLRLRPLGYVHLYGCWHASHPSNPPRPYTHLTGEVVSRIIGTGGPVVEGLP